MNFENQKYPRFMTWSLPFVGINGNFYVVIHFKKNHIKRIISYRYNIVLVLVEN